MVLTNAERQARYQQRLRQAAYENELLRRQIEELERHLNETRRAVGLPEIQLRKSAYGAAKESGMSGKIEGDPKAVLNTVQAIFSRVLPGATCELQDYEHRIGCGALDQLGNVQDVKFLRQGLSQADAEHFATVLATKVHSGGSTAGPIPVAEMDEDELEDRERAEADRDATRNSTTGY